MAINATKTLNFSKLDLYRSLNLPFAIDQYSTLNEKHNIGNVAPPSSGYPLLNYLGLGRGGHASVIGAGNSTLVDILEHSPTDTAFFDQIPFRVVPASADLAPQDRAKYRIRVPVTKNGIDYFAYYLKVVDFSTVVPTANVLTLNNGVIVSDTAYATSSTRLSPTPININNIAVNVSSGNHLIPQAVMAITLDTNDILGIIDACTIMYGDARYATISEVGIIGGFDVTISRTDFTVSATYAEIRSGQVMAFIATIQELQQQPASVTFQYSISNNLPLPN